MCLHNLIQIKNNDYSESLVRPAELSQAPTSHCRPENCWGIFTHPVHPAHTISSLGKSFFSPEEMWQKLMEHCCLQILGNFKGRTFCFSGKQFKDKEALKSLILTLHGQFLGGPGSWVIPSPELLLNWETKPVIPNAAPAGAAQPSPLP